MRQNQIVPYYYGRQGQDLSSHLQANIREYDNELAEDLKEAELHRKIAALEQDRQLTKQKLMSAAWAYNKTVVSSNPFFVVSV